MEYDRGARPGLRFPADSRWIAVFHASRRCLPALFTCLFVAGIDVHVATAQSPDDGRRAVKVDAYGISVRVPQAWRLISWSRDDAAFILRLPQDPGSKTGFVKCELGIAPERLEEYQKREPQSVAAVAAGSPTRKLIENKLEPLDEQTFGKSLAESKQRLLNVWELEGPAGERSFEVMTRVIRDGMLYSFSLSTDEAHFEAYRLDFDEMLASCQFTPLDSGVRRMPGGYWMQRDFRFALRLPEGWKPAFGPNDKVLFFAAGAKHSLFTDNLLVLASPVRVLDLEQLKTSLPGEIAQQDARAETTCKIVPQGRTVALETMIHTQRGSLKISILERRFRSETRNYEVKYSCETTEFKRIEAELRKSLDSFIEVIDEPRRGEA
jgi:hypothetical protein